VRHSRPVALHRSLTAFSPFGGTSGTSTYFNGDPAINSWHYEFVLVFGTGSRLIDPPIYAYPHTVTVTYQY